MTAIWHPIEYLLTLNRLYILPAKRSGTGGPFLTSQHIVRAREFDEWSQMTIVLNDTGYPLFMSLLGVNAAWEEI